MKRKSLSLLLALLMTASTFTLFSCSESDVNTNEKESSTPSADSKGNETVYDVQPEADANERLAISDELPELRFNGDEFRVITKSTDDGATSYLSEIMVEAINGDACNDAVYNRNGLIEDRFDVKITAVENDNPQDAVVTFATAGTDDAHVVGFSDYLAYTPITAGVLLNWIDMKYTDLDKPWHNKLANDAATINNQLYAICSDVSISSMTYTYAMYGNMGLAAQFNYSADDFYNLVKEGTWTLDKMIEITDSIYIDSNGSGTKDFDDIYGFGYYPNNPADVWLTAFGGQIATVGDDGKTVELTFMSDKTVSILEKLVKWHTTGQGFERLTTSYEEEDYFLNEKLVIAPMRFSVAYSTLREMESTYIILPYPKWDEAQEAYYTMADDKFTVFGIPTSVADKTDFISAIYEALSAESYKTVYPKYYDEALKGKYSSDPTTAEMVDLIMEGRAFDFSVQFGNSCFNRMFYLIRDMVKANDTNLSSKYRSVEKIVKKGIDRVLGEAYDLN